jgi:signal transduction histidine kinase
MNGIIGMTELALETELTTPEQREYLRAVKRSADVLLTTITNILEFSRIEKGEFTLEEIEFDLHGNLAETAQLLAPAAHRKGLELMLDIRPSAPRFVRGDPAQLRQILFHLIGNAVKFTDRGEILVQADLEPGNEEVVVLHFMVLDTGIGMQEEKQQVLSEVFSQADSSLTRKSSGTGLGLTIAARLVAIMGGRIWVESEPGRGSTFHFTARFKRVKERGDL